LRNEKKVPGERGKGKSSEVE